MSTENDELPPLEGEYRAETDEEKQEKSLDAEVASVIDQLGGTYTEDLLFKIYRLDPETGKRIWACDARPADMPLEPMLQKKHSSSEKGGDFEVVIYAPNPNSPRGGKSRRGSPVQISVDPPNAPAAEAAPAAPAGQDFSEVLERMQQSTVAMIEKMGEQQRLALENAVLKQQAQQGGQGLDLKQVLELLPLLRDVLGGNNNQQTSPIEQLGDLLDIQKKLRDEVGGGSSEDGGLLKSLDKVIDIVKEANQGQSTGQGQGQAAAARPNPSPRPAPPATTDSDGQAPDTGKPDEDNAMFVQRMVKEQLLFLCRRAEANRDPAVYAEYLLDEVPEAYYPRLLDSLGASDQEAVQNFGEYCPQVLDYAEWFKRLAACLREALVEPEPDADLTAPAESGDNTATHSDGEQSNETAARGAGGPPANESNT